MKLIAALFVLAIAIGIAVPAQALPHFVESKGVTYVANVNGAPRVSALVTSGATQLWTTVLPSVPSDLTLSLRLDKDVLYVTGYSESIATNTGFVWAVNATSGQILWFTTLPGGGIYSSATVSKDVVYVAGGAVGAPSRISALNAETGEILWQTSFAFPSFASPTIEKETVVIASGGFRGFPNNLIVLDAATGLSLQSIPVP